MKICEKEGCEKATCWIWVKQTDAEQICVWLDGTRIVDINWFEKQYSLDYTKCYAIIDINYKRESNKLDSLEFWFFVILS